LLTAQNGIANAMKNKSEAKPWNADADKPGSLSSLDILVRWLQTPGNYHRWQAEAKMPLAQEIANELKQQGLTCRSRVAVHHKLTTMEQQYQAATKWLKEGARLEQYHRGEAEEAVHRGVLRRCPLYLELTPIFDDSARQKEGSDGITPVSAQGEHTREAGSVGAVTLRNVGKKRSPDVLTSKSSLAKREKHGATHSTPEQINAAEDFQGLAGFHTVGESRWDDNFGVESVSYSEKAEDMLAEKLHQRRMEHIDAIAKVSLQAEQKRQDMFSRCAKVLARQKLRRGGLSEEDVDKIIPLPEHT
jgi:hypothetical protein